MADPIAVTRDGHRTFFKWHRARRRAADPAFTASRIVEGMRIGASVEVDLVVHGERGFAVLHDLQLGRESTGGGRVVDRTAAELRALRLRDNAGEAINEPVLLLEDLTALLARGQLHAEALLQLDFKEDVAALDPHAIAKFGISVGHLAPQLILSSGDAAAVDLLAAAAPGIRIGNDPCHGDALDRLATSKDFAGFVNGAVVAAPRAEMIYLAYELVLGAAAEGFDLVAAFHSLDRRVDAYTITAVDAQTRPEIERLLALRVDQITTDDAEALALLLS